MSGRLLPFALVFGAALADQHGAHALAFYALLVAVPLTAIAGLRSVSDRLDGKAEQAQAYVWAVVLALLLVATAARSPSVGDASVPATARSALIACVVVFCLQALAALASELRAGSGSSK
ncbi:MAG: hypothetical protein M3P15_08695 [Actinomycetota bacterium]|jgi:hypothetical protein|nr:hypothetical protein [Actinomycetota bacterium]